MPFTVVLLVLISCSIHAAWNLQAKRRDVDPAFFLVAGVLVLIPATPFFLLLGGIPLIRSMPATLWWCLLITGACQAAYYAFLALAYRNGDVSLVYPIARTAPLFVVPLSGLLQNRWPAPMVVVGILLTIVGCFFLPRRSLDPRVEPFAWRAYAGAGTAWALATAFASSGYTVADSFGMRVVGQRIPGVRGAFLYACLEWAASNLWLLLAIGWSDRRRILGDADSHIARTWRTQRGHTFVLGIAIFAAYLLILWAYSRTDQVATVAGLRQFSVVLGVVGGFLLLHEPPAPARIVGALIIVAGLVLVAVFR